mgnify:FL=1
MAARPREAQTASMIRRRPDPRPSRRRRELAPWAAILVAAVAGAWLIAAGHAGAGWALLAAGAAIAMVVRTR